MFDKTLTEFFFSSILQTFDKNAYSFRRIFDDDDNDDDDRKFIVLWKVALVRINLRIVKKLRRPKCCKSQFRAGSKLFRHKYWYSECEQYQLEKKESKVMWTFVSQKLDEEASKA